MLPTCKMASTIETMMNSARKTQEKRLQKNKHRHYQQHCLRSIRSFITVSLLCMYCSVMIIGRRSITCKSVALVAVDAAMSIGSRSNSKNHLSLSSSTTTGITTTTNRARFLSSSTTTFITGAMAFVMANSQDPEECLAIGTNNKNNNPRYIDTELQMKYGESPDGNPRTRGVLVRRMTGDNTPYQFPTPKPIPLVKEWPKDPPFTTTDFSRADSNDDQMFYTLPKLVYHIDEPAVAALTQYYRANIPAGSNILDICSSWVSHYPIEFPKIMKQICGTGMNGLELQYNDQLTGGYIVRDLNVIPKLPYDDETFDVVTCVVSIDYLIHPIEVLQEVNRVLKPGGKVIISQSNRCFPTKAIAMWLQMNDRQHLELINGYFQYAGGYDIPRKAYDITAIVPNNAYRDPMFIVEAIKSKK